MLGMAGVIPDGKGGAVKIVHRVKPDPDCECDLITHGDPADWLGLVLACTKCGSISYLERVTVEDILAWTLEAAEALDALTRRPAWPGKLEVTRAET